MDGTTHCKEQQAENHPNCVADRYPVSQCRLNDVRSVNASTYKKTPCEHSLPLIEDSKHHLKQKTKLTQIS